MPPQLPSPPVPQRLSAAATWLPAQEQHASRAHPSLLGMVHYSRHPGATTADGLLAARRSHRWYFDVGQEVLLRTALPDLDWQRAGGPGTEWSLAYGDFEALVFSFSTRESDPAFAGVWHSGILDEQLVDRSWTEVQKGMFPDGWTQTQLGTMMERLRVAAASPAVDPVALVVFQGATGQVVAGQPAMGFGQSVAERAAFNATSGIAADAPGAPYDRPPWLSAITFADGCLTDGVALTPAVDWGYYSLTRAASDNTVIGSAFVTFAEEAGRERVCSFLVRSALSPPIWGGRQ